MTLEEEQIIYRILFENSDEDCPDAIFEFYDTLTEFIQENYGEIAEDYHYTHASLPQNSKILQ